MLCDGVEADKLAEQNKELVKAMNKHMDQKLQKIKEAKMNKKEQ